MMTNAIRTVAMMLVLTAGLVNTAAIATTAGLDQAQFHLAKSNTPPASANGNVSGSDAESQSMNENDMRQPGNPAVHCQRIDRGGATTKTCNGTVYQWTGGQHGWVAVPRRQ